VTDNRARDGNEAPSLDLVNLRVSLFGNSSTSGTRATVWLAGKSPGRGTVEALSKTDESEATCWAWHTGGELHVRCCNRGIPIAFCGHGLLASAAVFQRYHELPKTVHTLSGYYGLRIDQENRLWLHCAPVPCEPVDIFPRDWFDLPPTSAAIAGDDKGYWILRWPDGFDITKLQPDIDRLSRETHRAVIATAAAPGDPTATLLMRYFAPQYGNPEDSVTGSACVVLGSYWHQPRFIVRQCSARGGLVNVERHSNTVAISGSINLHDPCRGGKPSPQE